MDEDCKMKKENELLIKSINKKEHKVVGFHISLPAKGKHDGHTITESYPIEIETYESVQKEKYLLHRKFVLFDNLKWLLTKRIPGFFFGQEKEILKPMITKVRKNFVLDVEGTTPKWVRKLVKK